MKKTISINISGQVFNIEEDSYEKLKNYLGAITKYFSSYGDSKEILTDIEGRIAEKFLDFLKKEEKQAISSENVDSIIASMGTVADFEAIKEEEDLYQTDVKTDIVEAVNEAKASQNFNTKSENTNTQSGEPRKFYRDTQRKIIGGVCAGIAHYFSIDPIWMRLLFLGCLGFIPVLAAFSAFIFILYIACWIAFPPNANIKEDDHIKKFFRDPDKKVLAGVVAGVSKYTGIDLAILRLLFVLSVLLAGTGVMVYLILWAIAPFAKTITDKMQMKGEPITLENIDSNIKSANNFVPKNESVLATILLFPFRILGKLFTAIGPLFQFLLVGVRIFAGILLVIIGFSTVVALITALFSTWGAFGDLPIGQIGDTPLHLIGRDAPKSMFFFLFFAVAIPFLAVGLAGFSLVTKRNIFNPVILQTMGGLWLMGILGAGMTASKFANNFKRNGIVEKSVSFTLPQRTPTLDIKDNEGWENYNEVRFYLEAGDSSKIVVNEEFEARGTTEEQAKINTKSIQFSIENKDSLFIFNRIIELAENVPFRGQELTATIKMPREKTFILTRRFAAHLNNFDADWDKINWELKENRVKGNDAARFKFDNSGALIILDEKPLEENKTDENGQYFKELSFNNFSSFDLNGNLEIEFEYGQNQKITAVSDSEADFDHLKITQENGKIIAKYNDNQNNENNTLKLKIMLPILKELNISDQVSATFYDINQDDLKLKISNSANVKLSGKIKNLNATLHDQSRLEALDLNTEEAEISTKNQSSAKINVEKKFKAESADQSEIEYKGKPSNISLSPNGQSKISQYEIE